MEKLLERKRELAAVDELLERGGVVLVMEGDVSHSATSAIEHPVSGFAVPVLLSEPLNISIHPPSQLPPKPANIRCPFSQTEPVQGPPKPIRAHGQPQSIAAKTTSPT